MISILMPVKNASDFLEECLDSILEQTYGDWELLAVDDHSSDNSFEILESYSHRDARIKPTKNQGKGIIAALHQAYKLSKGEFISRMDADDKMPINKLANLISLADRKVVVTGRVEYFSEEEVSEGYKRYEAWLNGLSEGEHYKHVYRECTVASPNWLVHEDFFEKDFEWETWSYPEDYDLVFRWKKAGYEIKMLDEVTHLWREHADRTSRTSERYQQASFFKLKCDWFIKNEVSDGAEVQLIGTERKAKLVKANLKAGQIKYREFSFEKREGYHSLDELTPSKKTILTNWPIDQKVQDEIVEFLQIKGFEIGLNCWIF